MFIEDMPPNVKDSGVNLNTDDWKLFIQHRCKLLDERNANLKNEQRQGFRFLQGFSPRQTRPILSSSGFEEGPARITGTPLNIISSMVQQKDWLVLNFSTLFV